MKTGLTKKQKTTSIFFTDADERIEVCTYNTALKNRLAAFAEKYPAEYRLIDDDENGCQTYGVNKIDELLKQPNCPFVLYVGTKKLVKRKAFEEFIEQRVAI